MISKSRGWLTEIMQNSEQFSTFVETLKGLNKILSLSARIKIELHHAFHGINYRCTDSGDVNESFHFLFQIMVTYTRD
jgi:hypothetical protein